MEIKYKKGVRIVKEKRKPIKVSKPMCLVNPTLMNNPREFIQLAVKKLPFIK